jgi:integrase
MEPPPLTASQPKLLDRVRDAIRARHYSRRTEVAYVTWIRRHIGFHQKAHPSTLGAPDISAFLTWLATKRHVSASTQNQALAALLFLYERVVHIPVGHVEHVVRAKMPLRLPVVLSRDEVATVLLLCDASSRRRVRHPHGPRASRSQGRQYDDGVYPRAKLGSARGQEPGGPTRSPAAARLAARSAD